MEKIKDILYEKINQAELVLVGIGEEFGESIPDIEKIPDMAEALNLIEENEEIKWMLPYLKKGFADAHKSDKIQKAYHVLENLLKDKNYFVVSTRMDDYIYQTRIKKERIVTPCGGYRFCHCVEGCGKQLLEADVFLSERIYESVTNGGCLEKIEQPVCPVCGKKLVFNNIESEGYMEEGYLHQWEQYMKWLKGTINRKLCVLELGVGMRYPTVIRWPFEKVVFFNQKSNIFRIHSKLYQLTEEIKDRGYKAEEKPIDFLINEFAFQFDM